jgi:F-type H+-transporting ATPase subunit delta
VEVKLVVDPSVIGGIVARVGDTVIDGSIAKRVESVRQVVKG